MTSTLEAMRDKLTTDNSGTSGKPEFELIAASELTLKPKPINWLVRNLLERESISLLYGAPASGKSLFALDWGFCIAKGMKWEGRPTQQAGVVIIAGEGFAGYARRLKALEIKHGIKAPGNLLLSKQSAQLQDPGSCDDVVKAIQKSCIKPGLIIIDTLNRNIDADENSSRDIAAFISNLDQFFKPLGAAVLVVHHSGHNESGRSRGSSAIRAAMDAEYCVSKDENTVNLSCTKAKDFEPPKPLDFALQQVSLDWLDDEMTPLTSVYLEYSGETIKQPKKLKLSVRERQILDSITDALRVHGIEPTTEIRQKFGGFGTGTFRHVVSIDQWREFAFKVIPSDCSQPRVTFKRARDKFLERNLTAEHDGYIWRIDVDAGVTKALQNDSVTSESNVTAKTSALQSVTENKEPLEPMNIKASREALHGVT
ncbi:AAA family ATPase [Methylobacter marinus]|uniref:AAA family ATPase n=1 Tax=Methylobacter marinus TaxID=34058 RepID=UPI00036F10E2|nr:AAA family ATPase [Methylobacter marinus]